MMKSDFSFSPSIASNICVRFQPCFGWRRTPQADSNFALTPGFQHVLEARQAIRDGAHVAAAAWTLFWPRSG